MAVNYGSLPFREQIDFHQAKKLVPTERWNDLQREAHDTGFMVAGATKADLLADLKEAIRKGIEEGDTLKDFRKNFDSIVAKRGWTGWTGSDSDAGVAWRTRVIYETNLRTSYQAGRWQQVQLVKITRPYLIYRHSDSVVTARAEHLAWDGLVVGVDDPWVQTHWPPNGFGCKCEMETLSERDLQKMGKIGPDTPPNDGTYDWTDPKTGEIHTFPRGIGPFWDYAPGSHAPAIWPREIPRPKDLFLKDAMPQIDKGVERWAKHLGMSPQELQMDINHKLQKSIEKSDLFLRLDKKSLAIIIDNGKISNSAGISEIESFGRFNVNLFRHNFESTILGVPGDQAIRPVYGYLSADELGQLNRNFTLDSFGDIAIKLRPALKARATASSRSMLSAMSEYAPSTAPQPIIAPNYKMMRWSSIPGKDMKNINDIPGVDHNINYFESHIHGGIELKDIDEIIFKSQPSKALVKKMEKMDLKWRLAENRAPLQYDDDFPEW